MLAGDTGKAAALNQNVSKFGITASSLPLAADFRSRRLLLPSDARGSGAFSLPFLLCWNDDVAMPAARTSGDELDEFKTASRIAEEASARLA
jgi:hypothetical protein